MMYKIVAAIACVVALFTVTTAYSQVCCTPSATERFASLASDEAFVHSHEAPLPISVALAGKAVTFGCSDHKDGSAYFVRSSKHPNDVVLMVHEYWGLNDYIRSEADKISSELGVSVIAVDLYDGKVATNPDDAGKYMKSVTTDRAVAIIRGALAYVGPTVKIATIGWCFGGGWSNQAAIIAGKQATACVMYYGMPESDVAKLKTLNCPVLGIFAGKDKWIDAKVVDGFKANMKSAGKQLTVYSYDADHGFANPSNPHHDATATKEAWGHASMFLRKAFGLN